MSDEQFNIHMPLKRLFDTREFPSGAAGGGPLEPTGPTLAPLPRPVLRRLFRTEANVRPDFLATSSSGSVPRSASSSAVQGRTLGFLIAMPSFARRIATALTLTFRNRATSSSGYFPRRLSSAARQTCLLEQGGMPRPHRFC